MSPFWEAMNKERLVQKEYISRNPLSLQFYTLPIFKSDHDRGQNWIAYIIPVAGILLQSD